jgi:hypothetical protein
MNLNYGGNGPGDSVEPKAVTYDGTFWYIADVTPLNRFVVLFDSTGSYVPRLERFNLASIRAKFESRSALLAIGFLKVEDGKLITLSDNDPRAIDFLMKEELRYSHERSGGKLVDTTGMTAVEAYSVFMNLKFGTPLRESTPQWKTAVNNYINFI